MGETTKIQKLVDSEILSNTSEVSDREIVLLSVAKILKLLFLGDVSGDITVTVEKKLEVGALFEYEARFNLSSCSCPPLEAIISGERNLVATSFEYQRKYSDTPAFSIFRNDAFENCITESLFCLSESQYSIVTRPVKEIKSSSIHYRFITIESTYTQISLALRNYLHHLYNVFHKTCRLSFHILDDETSYSTTFALPNEQTETICTRPILTSIDHYSSNSHDISLNFKPSKAVTLSYNHMNWKLDLAVSVNKTSSLESLSVILYGPYNIPVWRNAVVHGALDKIVRRINWDEYDIEIVKHIPHTDVSLLEPHGKWELVSANANRIEVTVIVMIKAISPEVQLPKKLKNSNIFHDNLNEILLENETAFVQSFQSALEKTWICGKELKRKRRKTLSVENTVNSLFDIICHSTNGTFNETCMTLMSSNSSHQFKQKLKTSLEEIAVGKHKKIKFSSQNEVNDTTGWELMENSI